MLLSNLLVLSNHLPRRLEFQILGAIPKRRGVAGESGRNSNSFGGRSNKFGGSQSIAGIVALDATEELVVEEGKVGHEPQREDVE